MIVMFMFVFVFALLLVCLFVIPLLSATFFGLRIACTRRIVTLAASFRIALSFLVTHGLSDAWSCEGKIWMKQFFQA
jgi:hypothetical protein